MATVHNVLSEQFYRWEQRGRGWQTFDHPVAPEPPFVPFRFTPPPATVDDGRRPTVLSSLVQGLSRSLATQPEPTPVLPEESEPEPDVFERQPLTELQISLPQDFDSPGHAFGHFLQSVSLCREPLSFELIGLHDRMAAQVAVDHVDLPLVRKQLQAFFPDMTVTESENSLASAWKDSADGDTAIVEFGLAREFMLPLATSKLDPFIGIVAALSGLHPGEMALFQVLFEPVRHPWAESISRTLNDGDANPIFVNEPELTKAGEEKAAQSLYAAVVRIATRATDFDRAWAVARDLASALRVFAHPTGNELIPLRNDNYPFDAHETDVLRRQSRRSGMILTLEELLGFVHVPSVEVPRLARQSTKTKAAPKELQSGLLLGYNTHAGQAAEVRLSTDQRVEHMHIIGASGTGKSTLLFNLIRQDIEAGEGVAVLDPHGDLIDRLLGIVPEERFSDVIVFDPSDEEYSIGFNVLSAHSDLEKNLLASDLVSVFERLSTSWGDQMGSVLRNAILASLESKRGGTLADMRRFLLETEFRNEFLQTVTDPEIVYYWRKGFPQLSGNKSIGPVLTRLETFLAPKPIRYMVSQTVNRLDFAQIMDASKIFLAKLSQGQIGKENSFLLGSLLVAKFQQSAMGRQAQRAEARRPFWLYIDEFHHFITPSMAEILTGARKYRLGLILAHQELRQLERDKEVASAALSACTRVVFRVGDADARALGSGFAFFEAKDLQNLETFQAICRVEKAANDFNLTVRLPEDEDPVEAPERRRRVITFSREKYGTSRTDVEAILAKRMEPLVPPTPSSPRLSKPVRVEAPAIVPHVSETPKPSEVPKPTPAGKEQPVTVPTTPAAPRDLGRGGAQHKAIQERLQTEAHALGFLAGVESQVDRKSLEAADLVLRRDDLAIAVEINVTNTIDHEFGNVKKCLAAGFNRVAVVSSDHKRLEQIASAVRAGLNAEAASRVSFGTPDEFIFALKRLAAEQISDSPEVPTERIVRGYKVRRHVPKLTPEERKAKENTALRAIAEAMKRRL